MTIIDSYCYCFSLRRGCFIIGIFTLIFHMGVVAGGSFYVHDTISVALLILSSIMVVLSILCVIASVFLIVGLCVESKKLLIPWIAVLSVTTCMDIVFTNIVFFFKREISSKEELRKDRNHEETPTIYAIDILMVLFNIYSILCVLSQYQDYCEGKGTAEYNYRNPRNNKFKQMLIQSEWCLILFPFYTPSLSPSLNTFDLKVTYSSQIKMDQNCKWKSIENSESRCQLMIPRHSLNTENSCVNSIDDVSNTSARSSITTTNVDRFYDNNNQKEELSETKQKCDQTVVHLEPTLPEDLELQEIKTSDNDFS